VYLNSDDYYEARPLTAIVPGRWDSILAVHHNRSNNYHALTAQLKTQSWHNLTSMIGYTWSKQMGTLFGENGEGGVQSIGGQWHPEWSYGPSDANHKLRFVAALMYQLPGTIFLTGLSAKSLVDGNSTRSPPSSPAARLQYGTTIRARSITWATCLTGPVMET